MADSHWRNTGHDARFGKLDAKAFSPFPVLMLIKSATILELGLIFLVFFFILDLKGLSFSNFLRKMRNILIGCVRPVRKMK